MPVISSRVYLISTLPEQTRSFLDELVTSKLALEVLNPEELDKGWDKFRYLKVKSIDRDTDLEDIEKIIAYYQGKQNIMESLTDNRPTASIQEILQVESQETDLLQIKELIKKFVGIEQESEDLLNKVSKIKNRDVFVLTKSDGFENYFSKFHEEVIHKFNLNHKDMVAEVTVPDYELSNLNSGNVILTCNINDIDSFNSYAESVKDSGLYTLKKYLAIQGDIEEKIIKELDEFGIDLERDPNDWIDRLVLLHAYYELEKLRHNILHHCFELENGPAVFLFVAVDPSSQANFEQILRKHNLPVQLVDWDKPIVNWQSAPDLQPFQDVAKSLGTIDQTQIDPTPIISFFFALFFAFCLSDALYGLLIALVTGYFLFFTNLKEQFKGMFRLFFWSGLATVLFGALTNSWAGDLLAKTNLRSFTNSVQLINPLDASANAPVNNFLRENGNINPIVALLVVAVAVGLVNILIAYILKAIESYRSKDTVSFRQDSIWIGFLISLVIWIVSNVLAPEATPYALGALAFFFLCLFITANGKSVLAKTIGGLGSLYNLISFFADIMSYTRLVAVGLTSGVIASVINLLAQLVYDSTANIPVLPFILAGTVLIGGHLFNLVISLFGAYINPLRLHYVEFLPKFYEGKGRSLHPIYSDFKLLKINN
ncbi:MAG: hypothetical protein OHK0017_01910 [Patescibacteria group bacterium]